MRFFFDNCMPRRLAEALAILVEPEHHEVWHLRKKFPENAADVDWLAALGGEGGWVIISGDIRITRNAAERDAWKESHLSAFFMHDGWPEKPIWDQVAHFFIWWPFIERRAARMPPSTGFEVPGHRAANAQKFKQII